MKVVINRCWGGFGLSKKALLMLYEMGSEAVESFEPKEYYGKTEDWERQFAEDQIDKGCSWGANVIVAPDGRIIQPAYGLEVRSDPALVKVVKKFGKKSWGWAAELKIVNIPDGTDYEIDNYDGIETIHEKHRVWY